MADFPTPEGVRLAVSAVALIGEDGRVLMQRRPLQKHHGGLWEFPGGKQEAGESAAEAACRELMEELGVMIRSGQLQLVGSAEAGSEMVETGAVGIVISLYICRNWQGDPQCLDAEEIGWFAADALDELVMPPLDRLLAVQLCERLENHH